MTSDDETRFSVRQCLAAMVFLSGPFGCFACILHLDLDTLPMRRAVFVFAGAPAWFCGAALCLREGIRLATFRALLIFLFLLAMLVLLFRH